MESASPLGLLGKLPSEVRNNVYDKLFPAQYLGNNLHDSFHHGRHRSKLRNAHKRATLSILCTSKTLSAEASAILYARSTFKFDPARCEADALTRRPQLVNYKRIRNLKIIIDYTSDFMLGVGVDVHYLNCHVLCGLAEMDLHPEGYWDATALVEFREAILYAFFLNLTQFEQALKTFTLCLKISDHHSLTRLIDNSIEDPLVATDFVRTLTMLIDLRKVVIELNGTLESLGGEWSKELPASKLFRRLSIRLGPCIEEKTAHDTKKGQNRFKRFTFFPAAHLRSEIAKLESSEED